MTTNQIAQTLATADETEKAQFAHFIADALGQAGVTLDDAGVRLIVAACDRYAAENGAD